MVNGWPWSLAFHTTDPGMDTCTGQPREARILKRQPDSSFSGAEKKNAIIDGILFVEPGW